MEGHRIYRIKAHDLGAICTATTAHKSAPQALTRSSRDHANSNTILLPCLSALDAHFEVLWLLEENGRPKVLDNAVPDVLYQAVTNSVIKVRVTSGPEGTPLVTIIRNNLDLLQMYAVVPRDLEPSASANESRVENKVGTLGLRFRHSGLSLPDLRRCTNVTLVLLLCTALKRY